MSLPLRSIFPINLKKLRVIFLNRNVRLERTTDLLLFFSNSSSFFFLYGTIKILVKFLIENSSKIDLKISGEGGKDVLSRRNSQQPRNEITRKVVIATCA